MRGFNYKKAIQALNYIANKNGGKLNKMKAIKLIWLADRYHVRKYGRTITGDVYFALPFGPIPSTTRDILETNQGLSEIELDYSKEYIVNSSKYDYSTISLPNLKVFSQTDIEVIDTIISKYNNLDPFALSELSHEFPEWKKYEIALRNKIASRFEIDVDDFFENIDDGYGLFLDNAEHLNISKAILFSENGNCDQCLNETSR